MAELSTECPCPVDGCGARTYWVGPAGGRPEDFGSYCGAGHSGVVKTFEEYEALRAGSEIRRLLDAAEMISYAGYGFRWHLETIVEALHVLSGCDQSDEYRRDRTCLDNTSCRFCGSKDGHVRSKLVDWAQREKEIWNGKRWGR